MTNLVMTSLMMRFDSAALFGIGRMVMMNVSKGIGVRITTATRTVRTARLCRLCRLRLGRWSRGVVSGRWCAGGLV